MATWSLVLSIVPAPILWMVSVGLGIAVLVRTKDGRDHGQRRVIAGFIVIAGWILVIIVVILVNVVRAAERDDGGSVTSRGDVPIDDIRAGDCLANDISEDVEMFTAELTPCSSPHYFEAYATFLLSEGDWPGQSQVDRLAEGGCIKRYEEFVGLSYGESEIEMMYLRPYEEGWAIDRGVACLLDSGRPTTGSLEGAAR